MKQFFLSAIALSASLLTAQAQMFNPTNLAIMQLSGNSSSGGSMTVVQCTTNGVVLNSVAIPSTGATNEMICGPGSSSEGYLSDSMNGALLSFVGYNTNLGAYSVALSSSSATTNSRAVGTIDGYGNYVLQFTGEFFDKTSIRSAVTDGAGNFWLDGGNLGILYANSSGASNLIYNSTPNQRRLLIAYSNIYYTSDSTVGAGVGWWEIAGLPTSGLQTYVPGVSTGSSNYEDMAINTNFNGTGIVYVADFDANSGIVRFTNNGNGGTWGYNYTITVASGVAGLAVNWSGAHPVLYATCAVAGATGEANALITITDTGASSTSTQIATAPAGSEWRGLCWAPGAYPTIALTNEPVSFTNDIGNSASFTVTPSGTAPFTYQWYSNNLPTSPTFVAIPGATNATLTLANLTAGQSNTLVYVLVSNAYGYIQSSNALLTVDPIGPPINVIVTPSSSTINATGGTSFTVSFAGATNSLTYGWTHNGAPVANGSLGASSISGAYTPTLSIANAFAVDDGTYVAYVTNSFGSGASTNNPGVLTVNDPAILSGIVGATNAPGGPTVPMSVTAIGTGLTYLWYSNGVSIGITTSNYTAPSSAGSNTVVYSVVVSSTDGSKVTNSTTVSYTPVLIYETFNYPSGANLFTAANTQWTEINGSNPEYVTNIGPTNYVQINQAEATTDGEDHFGYNVSGGSVLWASFILNVATNSLPSGGGVYFANFEDTNFHFFGQLYLITTNASENLAEGPMTPGVSNVAWPGTFRLGISGAQGDTANSSSTGPSAVIPLDMAPGINYEVVTMLDQDNDFAAVAVNPAVASDVPGPSYSPVTYLSSGETQDSINITNAMEAFGLRQRSVTGESQGVMNLATLECSWDWNGFNSGFGVVAGPYTPAKPVIGLQPVGTTNYSGNSFAMEIAASGIGTAGVGLTYQWYQSGTPLVNGTNILGATTPTLSILSLQGTNSGTYYCLVTGATGSLTNYSSNTVISVNTSPTAPSFTATPGGVEPPFSFSEGQGASVTIDANAIGTGPISYQWYLNNGVSTSPVGSSSSSGNLTLNNLQTNQSGSYYVVATGGTGLTGTSTVCTLTVLAPQAVTIGYLRSLMSPGSPPTVASTSQFIITGTNLLETNAATGGNTASMYIEDSTGGINLFVTLGETFRPPIGDVITAVGTLDVFDGNLELEPGSLSDVTDETSPSGSQTNLPTPVLLPWSYITDVNGAGVIAPAYLNSFQTNKLGPTTPTEGALVYMTNVYFTGTAYGAGAEVTLPNPPIFTNASYGSTGGVYPGMDYIISNNAGVIFQVYVAEVDQQFNGSNIPPFASTVTGVVYEDDNDTGGLTSPVWALILPSYASIVPGTPPSGGSAPVITNGPVSVTNYVGATVSFSVVAGTLPLAYQWSSNNTPLANGGIVSGATNSTLILSGITLADAATYSVTVTNGSGSTNASATLTVLPPPPSLITNITTSAGNVLVGFYSGDPYDTTNSFYVQGSTNLYAHPDEGFTNITPTPSITETGTNFTVSLPTNGLPSDEFFRILHK